MIDSKFVQDLIEQQIQITVQDKVDEVISNNQWILDLESRITQYVQDRITARFSNISTVPDLVSTVQIQVANLMKQRPVMDVEKYVSYESIMLAVDSSIQDLIKRTIDNLIIDSQWLEKIQIMANNEMASKVVSKLSAIDVNDVIVREIDAGVDRWQERLKQNFATAGIKDTANDLQLTVMDGAVVAENELISNNLNIEKDARIKGTLTVTDLAVLGNINTDNASWQHLSTAVAETAMKQITERWRQSMVDDVIELAKTHGIEFASVAINGKPLISGSRLNADVRESSLETVGHLRELVVSGNARIQDTFNVVNKRVGINTEDPEMSLSIWDEEVSIVAGKINKNHGYIGTARLQNLSLGVNRQSFIDIDVDGLVTVKSFRIGRHRIGHSAETPGYSGVRGDFVLNSDPKPDTPFAWVCLGGFRWQPLKVS